MSFVERNELSDEFRRDPPLAATSGSSKIEAAVHASAQPIVSEWFTRDFETKVNYFLLSIYNICAPRLCDQVCGFNPLIEPEICNKSTPAAACYQNQNIL